MLQKSIVQPGMTMARLKAVQGAADEPYSELGVLRSNTPGKDPVGSSEALVQPIKQIAVARSNAGSRIAMMFLCQAVQSVRTTEESFRAEDRRNAA